MRDPVSMFTGTSERLPALTGKITNIRELTNIR